MLMAPPPNSQEEYIQRFAETWKFLRVGAFPEDEARDRPRCNARLERGLNPAGVGRQLRAVLASGSRKERLHAVKAPTLVIHGTVDPLVHPEGGQGHRGVNPRREAIDDRRHGPRAADPDVAADHRRHRPARAWRGGEGGMRFTPSSRSRSRDVRRRLYRWRARQFR